MHQNGSISFKAHILSIDILDHIIKNYYKKLFVSLPWFKQPNTPLRGGLLSNVLYWNNYFDPSGDASIFYPLPNRRIYHTTVFAYVSTLYTSL